MTLFPPTSWTLVALAAGDEGLERGGLERLCRLYWRPVHWHLRTRWSDQEADALDLTSAFFTWLIEHDLAGRAELGRGSFRGFLRTSLDNFVKNELRSRQTLKAGGAESFVSIDSITDTDLEPPTWSRSADFDALFAASLMEDAVADLVERLEAAGETTDRRAFEAWFLADEPPTQKQLAAELGLSVSALARLLERTRRALRSSLRARLRDTLCDPADLDEEFALLFGAAEPQA